MDSLVLQLQEYALDSKRDVSDLLRMSLVAARKLEIEEFAQWAGQELNGYDGAQNIPEYRNTRGSLEVWNTYHG